MIVAWNPVSDRIMRKPVSERLKVSSRNAYLMSRGPGDSGA